MNVPVPDSANIEQRMVTPEGSCWHPFTGWHECYIYRIKPKAKVKKWRWVYQKDGGWLGVTSNYYHDGDNSDLHFIQRIDSTMIEVNE